MMINTSRDLIKFIGNKCTNRYAIYQYMHRCCYHLGGLHGKMAMGKPMMTAAAEPEGGGPNFTGQNYYSLFHLTNLT